MLDADPSHNPILPGMTVQADITTRARTVLQYLLRPIQVSRDTAFDRLERGDEWRAAT